MDRPRTRILLAATLGVSFKLVRSQLTSEFWPSTAFAPPTAAVTSLTATVNFTGFAVDYSTYRFTGTINNVNTELVTFSAVTDGGVRLWIDDHLVIDDGADHSGTRKAAAFLGMPMIANEPLPIKLEYSHYESSSILQLFWSGNTTVEELVPASAFLPSSSAAELQRQLLRNRLQSPRDTAGGSGIAWQTYDNPTMGSHVHMPDGFTVTATLADTKDGAVLGDIIVFRRMDPAVVQVGGHSLNGSDYTRLDISLWKSRDCDVSFQTTVLNNGSDLQFLAISNGTDCSHMALLLLPQMLAERYGNFSMGSDGASIVADRPGFPPISVHAIGATPIPFANANASVYLALPLGSNNAVVGYCTGSGPCASIPEIQNAIESAYGAYASHVASYGPDLAPLYEPVASVICWNTMYTPYEGGLLL